MRNCCLTDPNALDTPKTNPTPDDNDNIYTHPGFAYPNYLLGNFHLAYDSPCVNMGDPNETDVNELDIDGDARENGIIDIGADEMTLCSGDPNGLYNVADITADGVVNLEDHALFSAAWLARDPNEYGDPNMSDPNETQNFNEWCNLDATGDSMYVIDLADLELFRDNWLWVACWRLDLQSEMTQQAAASSMMMAAPMMSFEAITTTETTLFEPEVSVETYIQIIDFLDDIIADESDNINNIEDMKAVLEDELRAVLGRESN